MSSMCDATAARRGDALRRVALSAAFLTLASQPVLAGSAKIQGQGIASFYGREHHGGPTASGERFDMRAMTAAHRTAPLGSRLKVTNLRNGRAVIVRINDRGPFVRGRIIDLSRGAAEVLGFTGAGLTRVSVETAAADASTGPVQVAALESETTGSISSAPAASTTAAADKTVLTDVDRMLIARSAAADR